MVVSKTQKVIIGSVGISGIIAITLYLYVTGFIAVPRSVNNAFIEKSSSLRTDYDVVNLRACHKRAKIVYTVTVENGYVGMAEYFNSSGTSLGEVELSDAWVGIRPKAPIDLSDYRCRVVATSDKNGN